MSLSALASPWATLPKRSTERAGAPAAFRTASPTAVKNRASASNSGWIPVRTSQ
jgi:hypothetical protein